jgi:hypothetical protein
MAVQIQGTEIIFLVAVIVIFSQGIPTVFTTIPNSCFQPKYGSFSILLVLFDVYFLFILANPLYCRALTFTSLTALCVIARVTTTVSAPSVHSHCPTISEPHFAMLGLLFCCEIFNKVSCQLSYIYLYESMSKNLNTN